MANFMNSSISLERLLLDSGLNEDCLLEIFFKMNIDDLLVFCDFDVKHKSFLTIIKKHVASRVLFDLDAAEKIWTIPKVLEIFGDKISKLKLTVSISTFNDLLENIIDCCDPNILEELHIIVKFGFRLSYEFITLKKLKPFLKNLTKLKVECKDKYQKNELKSVLDYFSTDLDKMKALEINGHQLFKYCLDDIESSDSKFTNIIQIKLTSKHTVV